MNLLRPALAALLTTALLVPAAPAALAAGGRMRLPSAASEVAATPSSAVAGAEVAGNELIVRLEGGVTADKLTRIYRGAETSAGAVDVVAADVLTFEAPAGESLADFADKLEDTGEVVYAEPNYIRQPAGYTPLSYTEPNDPAYTDTDTWGYLDVQGDWTEKYLRGRSWWLRDVRAMETWQKGFTGSDIVGKYPLRADGKSFKIAVLDTGVYPHPDRNGYMTGAGTDYTPVDPSRGPYQPYKVHTNQNTQYVSHGTAVAGIIGAAVGNSKGTLGIARDTQVAVYKVYFGGAGIDDADIIAALHRSANDGCRVINMSLAGGPYSQPLQDAVDYAWNKGCVIVAATGNNGAAIVSFPAALNHVVAVGALEHGAQSKASSMDGARRRASYSNYGAMLDVTAPGSWIWGLTKPDYKDPDAGELGYRWWDGTSMASPIVAGGIAVLWRAAPWMTNAEVISLVQETADDLGAAGKDVEYGYGGINLAAAYDKLISDYPLLAKPVVSASPAPDGRSADLTWTPVSGHGITYDVSLDGVVVRSGLTETTATVSLTPAVTSLRYYRNVLSWTHTRIDGQREVTIAPRSARNWADGTEQVSTPIATAGGTTPTVSLTVDGIDVPVSDDGQNGSMATTTTLGVHTAVMKVTDNLGRESEPATFTFTVRPKPEVKRVWASNRYDFAKAVSASEFTTASTAVLVGSSSWMDAVAAAPLAHVVGGPVLPVYRTSLPRTVSAELKRLGVRKIIIVGNTVDVSSSLYRSLKKRYSVVRISGNGRYETANAVARSVWARSGGAIPDGKAVVVGDSFQYAVAASAVAARKGWPLLYTTPASVPVSTRHTLQDIGVTSTLVVGGTISVQPGAAAQLPDPERISGTPSLSVPTLLAAWATANHPAEFSGERIYLANSTSWVNGLGVPAAAARRGGLVLLSTPSLTSPVRSYYTANSETAVTTRIMATTAGVTSSSFRAIKGIVGAQ